ncbi:MAG: DUF58 domain-containing protein [Kiritimatiellae bacterium]|nr:DUF58 domain-containing protein [Kiritimatiellia bacterium]
MTKKWTKYFDAEAITKLSHIGFKPSGLVEGSLVGNHRSPFHGFAIEFAGHRGYVPGDDVKHIDWKAFYKTDKYLIKQYEQETNFVAHLLIDISKSMHFEYQHGTKQDYTAFIATAISQIVVNQSDSVNACFFDEEIVETTGVTNSMDIISKIAAFYEDREFKSPSAIGKVLQEMADQVGRRQVIFLISDLFGDTEETFNGIKRLMDAKHEIVLLHIVDPLEINFNIPGRVKFIEMEGEEEIEARGVSIKDSYEELFHDFLKKTKEQSLKLGIDYILCDTSKSFGFHLAEYMSGRMFRP